LLLLLLLLAGDNTSSDVTMTQRPLSAVQTTAGGATRALGAAARRALALSQVTRPECIRRH